MTIKGRLVTYYTTSGIPSLTAKAVNYASSTTSLNDLVNFARRQIFPQYPSMTIAPSGYATYTTD
jgi:hypothetical protein